MVIDDIVYFGVAPQAVRGGPKSPLAVGECSCGCDRSDRKVAARARAMRQRQRGIMALAVAARMGVARKQRRWQVRQEGTGRGQRSGNNSSKIRGDAVRTAVRRIAKERWQDKGSVATTKVIQPRT